MKKIVFITLLSLGLMAAVQVLNAQSVQFKVELLADGVTYRVSLKPSVTWTTPNNNTLGAQVTLLAPTGSFQLTNITNINGIWTNLPTIVAPTENRTKDYFVISLASSAALPYTANVETPLFTFKRGGACTGTIELIDNNTDPFIPPNSQSLNVGNYVATRGGGGSSTNLWSANYGGAADCRNCSIDYKLIPLSTGKYQVSMIPKVNWSGALSTTATQQVTLIVPTGGFQVTNLTNLVSGVSYMLYSRFDAPTENPTKDYLVFNLQSLGTRNLPYVANTEVPLFTFENSGTCGTGNVELMNNSTDSFRAPNSRSANVGQQLTTVGGGVDVPICLNTNYLAACSKVCPNPSSNFLGDDGALCSGQESNLGIVSNFTNVQWTPTTGLSCANCVNPKATITRDTRYIVTATNPQTGCPVRDTLILYVLPVPVISGIDTIPSISCTTANGSIVIRATVITGDSLEYSIDNGLHWQDSPIFNNLVGGTYIVCSRTKIDKCVVTFTGNPVFFRPATPPSVSSVVKTDITDCNLTNGSIRITATGNTNTLKYSINGGTTFSNSSVFNNLSAGNYTVVVTNSETSCSTNYPQTVVIAPKACNIFKVTGMAFRTCNANSIRDANAQLMPNIVVILRGGSPNILKTAITNAQGIYSFDTVAQGSYTLTFGLPMGYNFGTKNRGTDRNIDSDVDPATGIVNVTIDNSSPATQSFDAGYRDIEAPVITTLNPLLINHRSGDTLTFSCQNPSFFKVGDVKVTDNVDTLIVIDSTGRGIFTQPVTRVQFIDVGKKIGNCARDGYALLLECDWRATDNCGNIATFKIFIKITDDQAPILRGVPADTTVTSEANIPVVALVTASDNCTTGIVPLFNQTQNNTAVPCEYLITRTWTATDDCGNSTRATQKILVKKDVANCNLRLCAPSVLSQDSVVVSNACGAQPKACINLPKNMLENYTILVNNQPYTAILEGCKFDTAISYSYFTLPNRGASGTFNLDYWVVNGRSYSVQNIPSVQALVDTMNRIDPTGRWLLDPQKYCITRTNYAQMANYGDIKVSYPSSGSYALLQVNRTFMPYGTVLNISRGRSVIGLINKTTGCTDSIAVYATCLTNGRVEMAMFQGQTKEQCLDFSQMLGSHLEIKKITPLSKNASFSATNTSPCLQIKAIKAIENDSVLYVVSDEFGLHDTTVIVFKIQAQLAANQAKLFNDSIITRTNKHIVFDVLHNDSIYSNRVSMTIVQAPQFGMAYKTSDFRIFYEPQLNYCDNKEADELTYSICTPLGCDTAKVKILVLCDALHVNTGFSPNGDGVNDYFVVDGIELYPLSILSIYDRWGTRVYQKTGYKNDWDGTWQNKQLPDGTYFYQIDIKKDMNYTGYLQLNR